MLSRLRVWWSSLGRDLYRYYDGSRWRRADPIAAGTALSAACPKYRDLLVVAATDPQEVPMGEMRAAAVEARRAAVLELAGVARKVFDLPPLGDVRGVTDFEALGVLVNYCLWMRELADAAQVFTTSRQPA